MVTGSWSNVSQHPTHVRANFTQIMDNWTTGVGKVSGTDVLFSVTPWPYVLG